MSVSLDSRQVRIAQWLLNQREPQSTAVLAADLGLSQRVIRYRLAGVERYLQEHDLQLVKRRGVGLTVEGEPEAKAGARAQLADATVAAPRVFARDERLDLLRATLLAASPEAVTLEHLHEVLDVSQTSARRDTKLVEPWFEQHNLVLARKPGAGVSVAGTEIAVRRALLKLLLEAVPADAIRQVIRHGYDESDLIKVRVSSGLRDFLRKMSLRECDRVVAASELALGASDLELPLHLAITAARIRDGRSAALDPGLYRSLIDHPVSATASGIATSMRHFLDIEVDDQEIAALTEFLLGLVSLEQSESNESTIGDSLVDDIMAIAAERLHPALVDDAELRRGIRQHLERLQVRLKYSLPVHNPLLAEVANRYPDVHATAQIIATRISSDLDQPLPQDEVGFLTMYLSGSMERTHLWPQRRAVIVCPSGMATVWILVSRIQAEFPELEIVDVVAASGFGESTADSDLVISTVELPEQEMPVAIVSALLTPEDVRSISRLLAR